MFDASVKNTNRLICLFFKLQFLSREIINKRERDENGADSAQASAGPAPPFREGGLWELALSVSPDSRHSKMASRLPSILRS